jgi:hypothetical protein
VRELTTNQKGAIAEAAITKAAVELGIEVYRPVVEGGRYDLIFAFDGGSLMRVQCKWAARHGDVLLVRCYSCRRAREGMRVRRYTEEEVDAIAAFSLDTDECYYLPATIWSLRGGVHLRLEASRNNQRRKIHWAEEYEFAARLSASGPIAQLGERLAGSQKVGGSNPPGST